MIIATTTFSTLLASAAVSVSTLLASAAVSPTITIPSIGLNGTPVYQCKATEAWSLQRCVNQNDIIQDRKRNVLMGHVYRSLSKLYNEDGSVKIKRGDKIVFAGKHYKVASIRVIKNTATLPSADLVIMTCYPYSGIPGGKDPVRRLIVVASRT